MMVRTGGEVALPDMIAGNTMHVAHAFPASARAHARGGKHQGGPEYPRPAPHVHQAPPAPLVRECPSVVRPARSHRIMTSLLISSESPA